jgi:hypothetical protein
LGKKFLQENLKGKLFKLHHMKERGIEYEHTGAEIKICKREEKKSKIDLRYSILIHEL